MADRDPESYTPVYGTPETDRLQMNRQGYFFADQPKPAPSLYAPSLSGPAPSFATPRAAKAPKASKAQRKLTPEEMDALADMMMAQIETEGNARLAAGPAVGRGMGGTK